MRMYKELTREHLRKYMNIQILRRKVNLGIYIMRDV